MANTTVDGECFCGAVRFSIELPTLFCGHCHCTMCRRAHGAGFVTWIAVARSQFRLETPDALTRFASSDHGTRSFCRTCGSSLFCQSTHHPDVVDIVLANMKGEIDKRPECHIYWDDRVEWVEIGDELPRKGGVGGMEPTGQP